MISWDEALHFGMCRNVRNIINMRTTIMHWLLLCLYKLYVVDFYTFDPCVSYVRCAHHSPQVYHLPINEAAAALNIGVTVLKKYCRKFRVPRWPYRKLQSMAKLIESFERYKKNAFSNGDIEGAADCQVGPQIGILQVGWAFRLSGQQSFGSVLARYRTKVSLGM